MGDDTLSPSEKLADRVNKNLDGINEVTEKVAEVAGKGYIDIQALEPV